MWPSVCWLRIYLFFCLGDAVDHLFTLKSMSWSILYEERDTHFKLWDLYFTFPRFKMQQKNSHSYYLSQLISMQNTMLSVLPQSTGWRNLSSSADGTKTEWDIYSRNNRKAVCATQYHDETCNRPADPVYHVLPHTCVSRTLRLIKVMMNLMPSAWLNVDDLCLSITGCEYLLTGNLRNKQKRW